MLFRSKIDEDHPKFIGKVLCSKGIGAIKRRGTVEQHNTVSDNTDLEHERENTIFSHQMFVNWKKNKINILDTPGFDDFVVVAK